MNTSMNFWFRLPLRTRLGIVAAILLAVAAVSVYRATHDPLHHKPLYSLIKFAPVLFLLWLAWSDLQNIPFWAYIAALPVIIICALKPAALFIVVPLALIVLFIMPKKK